MKKIVWMLLAVLSALFTLGCGGDEVPPPREFDYGSLPFYSADAANRPYSYTDEERVRPFWLGNTMYNESVMFLSDGESASAKTLFTPLKVLAVYDWTLKKQFVEGEDYTVAEDGTLVLTENSSIPVFSDGWAYGKEIPDAYRKVDDMSVTGNNYRLFDCFDEEGNSVQLLYTEGTLIYERYVHVTYVFDPAAFDYTAVKAYAGELSGLEAKLKAGEPINMVVFGDSTSEGCSASKHWNRDPFSPFYGELVKDELERLYSSEITLTNMSVGGKTSKWAVGIDTSDNGGYNLTRLRALAPDLLVIGFGLNDAGAVPAEDFAVNINTIAEAARGANPNCQIIFLNAYPGNPYFVSHARQEAISAAYEELSYQFADAAYIDLYRLGTELLKSKHYYEISANNLNHPNDFMHRVYAMNILSAVVDYSEIER